MEFLKKIYSGFIQLKKDLIKFGNKIDKRILKVIQI